MRRRTAVIAIVCAGTTAGALVLSYWDSWRLTRDLGPIVYRGEDGLCSVQPSGDEPPFCPHVFLGSPELSADGRWMAAERRVGSKDGPGPATEIVIADRRGAVVQRLRGSEDFIRPVWGHDGQHVFALNYKFARAAVRWGWPKGEKTIVQIYNLPADDHHVQRISFSASGRRAALLGNRFERVYLADFSPEGFQIHRALALPFTYVSFPVWLDETRFLATARTERGAPAGLWEINVDSGTVRKLETPGLAMRDSIVLSPDKTSVVVTATQLGGPLAWSLWRVKLDTPEIKRLTTGREDISPSWGG